NRRAVDFSARRSALAALESGVGTGDLLSGWRSGRIKQAVLARALKTRRAMPGAFMDGSYWPVQARGRRADSVLAFMRAGEDGRALAVAPRLCFAGVDPGRGLPAIEPSFW